MFALSFDKRLGNWPILEANRLESERLLKAWRWKSMLDASFPLIVSLVGGTGTGKSTVFNSLAGRQISEVGHRRPCTLRAIIFAPEHDAQSLSECPLLTLKNQPEIGQEDDEAEIVTHLQPELSGLVLVDTPDIDSVELSNRVSAENFFILSDAVVFVTSQEKYGDLTVHEMTERARQWGKKTLFVMNKVASDVAYNDFRNALAAQGFVDEPIRIERLHASPQSIPGLRDRPEFAIFFANKDGKGLDQDMRTQELNKLCTRAVTSLDVLEHSVRIEVRRMDMVNDRIRHILSHVVQEMRVELSRLVTPDVETHIRERLHQLTAKYDILFVPRKKLREAVKQAVETIFGWFRPPWGEQPDRRRADANALPDLYAIRHSANLAPLEAAIAKLNQRVAETLSSDPALDDLCRIARAEVPRWNAEKIHELYYDAFPGVEKLLEVEFKRFQDGLPLPEKIRLYGWSTIWAVFVITMEIVVGGGFTLLDALLNTAILPSIPTLVLKAKVAGLLKEIAERVDREQRRILDSILEEQARAYIDKFESLLPADEELQGLWSVRQSLGCVETMPISRRHGLGAEGGKADRLLRNVPIRILS